MTTAVNTGIMLLNQASGQVTPILLIALVKGAVVFAAVAPFLVFARRLPPGFRQLVWLSLLASLLVLPLLSFLVPEGAGGLMLAERFFGAGGASLTRTLSEGYRWVAIDLMAPETLFPPAALPPHGGSPPIASALSWSAVLATTWFFGFLGCSARIVAGCAATRRVVRGASAWNTAAASRLNEVISKDLSIARRIPFLVSPRCNVPFTCGSFRPVVVLPLHAARWPEERLRAVLTHELTHVRRRDHLTRTIARFICSLFWFVPSAWVSYRHLRGEQERACDASVLDSGIEAARYAGHLIQTVRTVRRRVFLTGIHIMRGSKKALERRILAILSLERARSYPRSAFAAAAIALFFVFAATMLAFHPGPVHGPYRPKENEPYYGTWVNEDYENISGWNVSKIVYTADGTYEGYNRIDAFTKTWRETFSIQERWADVKGNIWYKVIWVPSLCDCTQIYELARIGDSGRVYEASYSNVSYPRAIDPKDYHSTYRIYRR